MRNNQQSTETAAPRSRDAESRPLSEPEPPYLDSVFGTLQNRRRRLILRYLRDSDGTTTGDLAVHVAAIENEISEGELRSPQRKRVYVSLYQSHLPKLADVGAIDYDRDRGTVEPGDRMDTFLRVLDGFDGPAETASRVRPVYTLSGGGLLLAALAVVAVTESFANSGQLVLLVAILLMVGGAGMLLQAYRL